MFVEEWDRRIRMDLVQVGVLVDRHIQVQVVVLVGRHILVVRCVQAVVLVDRRVHPLVVCVTHDRCVVDQVNAHQANQVVVPLLSGCKWVDSPCYCLDWTLEPTPRAVVQIPFRWQNSVEVPVPGHDGEALLKKD